MRRAAEMHDCDGMVAYGRCLERGIGTAVDWARAAALYRSAAERKHSLGQISYGRALEKGIGVEVDKRRAASYYKLAADQGDAEGEYQFARCLEFGIGVNVGHRLASIYYKWAANQGFESAEEGYNRCIAKLADESSIEPMVKRENIIVPKKWKHISLEERKIDLRGFQVMQELVSRRNSIVQVLKHIRTSRLIVLKYYQLGGSFDSHQFATEADILINLYHPCILPVRGISPPEQGMGCGLSTKFMENGSLDDVFYEMRNGNRPTFWTDTNIAVVIMGIIMGMRYLHRKGVVHRNLKPSNLLIDHLFQIKIADFATSKLEELEVISSEGEVSIAYIAPELESGSCSNLVDVYSFGIVLYELVMSSSVVRMEDQWKVCEAKMDIPSSVSPVIRELVNRCCSVDPAMRPSFKTIFNDLEKANFVVLPDADASVVAGYVRAISRWELEWLSIG
jgi:hypothetical protein